MLPLTAIPLYTLAELSENLGDCLGNLAHRRDTPELRYLAVKITKIMASYFSSVCFLRRRLLEVAVLRRPQPGSDM